MAHFDVTFRFVGEGIVTVPTPYDDPEDALEFIRESLWLSSTDTDLTVVCNSMVILASEVYDGYLEVVDATPFVP